MQMCTMFLMEVCLKSNSNIHLTFFRTSRFSTPTFYIISNIYFTRKDAFVLLFNQIFPEQKVW